MSADAVRFTRNMVPCLSTHHLAELFFALPLKAATRTGTGSLAQLIKALLA